MKKMIIYFCVGALLSGLVLIAYDAIATTPNPGHPLTCTVSGVNCPPQSLTWLYCPDGMAATAWWGSAGVGAYSWANNGFYFQNGGASTDLYGYVRCCRVGI